MYGGGDICVNRFIDLDFQYNMDDRKSISGFMLFCNRRAFSYKSFKQEITTNSTTEVKHVAACDAAKEVNTS